MVTLEEAVLAMLVGWATLGARMMTGWPCLRWGPSGLRLFFSNWGLVTDVKDQKPKTQPSRFKIIALRLQDFWTKVALVMWPGYYDDDGEWMCGRFCRCR